ncbi:MAG: sugar-binding domain-containing protein [Muribaculaceae bacterium]
MKLSVKMVLLMAVCAMQCGAASKGRIDLAGEWQFATDSIIYDKIVKLPGSVVENGYGDEIGLKTPWTGSIIDSSYFKTEAYAPYREAGNIKVPFWLQPKKYYKDAAWFRREVVIPKDWRNREITLHLERCHWETCLWVDGKEVGMQNSLGTPHRYDLSEQLTPGKHVITLRVDNRVKSIDPGRDSHSISDHTQGNWNGIVGEMYLEAKWLVNVNHTAIYPELNSNSIKVVNELANRKSHEVAAELVLKVGDASIKKSIRLSPGITRVETTLPLGSDVRLWDEFTPNLYTLEVSLTDKENKKVSAAAETFGMRRIEAIGRRLAINSHPLFLRGTLDCATFPKTGYPPTDKASWIKIYKMCKAHGLNHVRCHSWCPPEAAFAAADEVGMYLEVECSSWANSSTTLGDGRPIDQYIKVESEAMLRAYGNHPSFIMMLYGNEPAGSHQGEYLTEYVNHMKSIDNRRLYSSGAGWPNLPVNDFLSSPSPRIQGWGEGLSSIINGQKPRTDYDWSKYCSDFNQPVVSHEIGQWCVYPNFKEMSKYDGVMQPQNFEIFKETLQKNGMAELADSFLLASGKLQTLCYKADIEAALRTREFGGFQLLGLNDFPGQGTALVGVLDAFWGEKGYVSPEEFNRFCGVTTPLVRLPKLVYTNAEQLVSAAEVAHYGNAPIKNACAGWTLTGSNGKVYAQGKWNVADIELGNSQLGEISASLAAVASPQCLTLEVQVDGNKNSWHIWVYPSQIESSSAESDILVADSLDDEALAALNSGKSVLLSLPKGALSKDFGGNIAIGFSSIFWNTAWTRGQAPHTLGILCNPSHPALAEFPTDYHSDYQWWDAMSHSGAIEFAKVSPEIQPLVRVIDDWFTNRPLALLFEVKVGKGKLLVSGIDFWQDMDNRPEAKQLLHSLKKYMATAAFNPQVEVKASAIAALYAGE